MRHVLGVTSALGGFLTSSEHISCSLDDLKHSSLPGLPCQLLLAGGWGVDHLIPPLPPVLCLWLFNVVLNPLKVGFHLLFFILAVCGKPFFCVPWIWHTLTPPFLCWLAHPDVLHSVCQQLYLGDFHWVSSVQSAWEPLESQSHQVSTQKYMEMFLTLKILVC